VLDYHERDWPEQVRVDAAVNAARSGSADAVRAVRDGGRLATITSDLPDACRGITMTDILVAPDGARLRRLVALFARADITVTVGARYPLEEAAAAMARVHQGTHGEAIVLTA
jgi:NADPH:quinone reductase-like Zn-dependent oxidoreductase